jgi:hypothetical protein
METKMHRTCLVAVAALGFATVAFAADEHNGRPGADQPAAPASGSLSSDLNRSGGVITPPAGIDTIRVPCSARSSVPRRSATRSTFGTAI